MITFEVFRSRCKDLWNSQKRMAAPRKWKSGKRAGTVRVEASPIEFDYDDLERWLSKQVGLNIITCPYCRVPIDILNLTIDHITPRALGGRFALDNMQCICCECNERKGKFSGDGFKALLEFSRSSLHPHDEGVLLSRLRQAAGFHGTFRKPTDQAKKLPPPPKQEGMDFNLGAF
jgi:hypothetical protein